MVVKVSRSGFLLVLTLVLSVLLVASNVWWLYVSIDAAVTETYSYVERETADFALRQSLTLLPVAFAAQDKEGFLAAAEQRLSTAGPEAGGYAIAGESLGHLFAKPREKDGCVWLGKLGFLFDEKGTLQHVSRNLHSDGADPCFPDLSQ